MSRGKLTINYVACDFPNCVEHFEGGAGDNLHVVKTQAIADGWHISRQTKDLCPAHLAISPVRHKASSDITEGADDA